jgi:hypothetical protein
MSVRVGEAWYEVIGFALTHYPDDATTGSVFTLTPYGDCGFEPCLGYRIDYEDIDEARRPNPDLVKTASQ